MEKVIVCHLGALTSKYKERVSEVLSALEDLKKADATRGVATRLVHIDQATMRDEFGGTPSSRTGRLQNLRDEAQQREAKEAVDRIASSFSPVANILILDGPDVIPHVTLENPNALHDDFGEETVDSDLPYASDTGYSCKVSDFLNITRVVARIPNVPGSSDPQPVVRALNTAAKFKPRPPADYRRYFAVSAPEFRFATEESLRRIFGKAGDLNVVPPAGLSAIQSGLSRLTHFINCHGVTNTPEFYGGPREDDATKPTVAMDSAQVAAKKAADVLVLSECCFGAQLYDPQRPIRRDVPISISYLANGCVGYLGSTNIAFGGHDKDNKSYGRADLLLVFFANHVLSGASLGMSLAKARQELIGAKPWCDGLDLKTLAQFLLFGDPSTTVCDPGHAFLPRNLDQLEVTTKAGWIPSEKSDLPEPLKEKVRSIARQRGYPPSPESKETIFRCTRWGSAQPDSEAQVFVMTISCKDESLFTGEREIARTRHIVAYIVDGRIEDVI